MSAIYILWLRELKRYTRSRVQLLASLGQPLLYLLALCAVAFIVWRVYTNKKLAAQQKEDDANALMSQPVPVQTAAIEKRVMPIYLTALGTVTLAAFLAAMTTGRWFGPRLIDRYGRVPVLRVAACVALAGLLVVGFSGFLPAAIAGAVLMGLGTSLGFPVGMSAAADDPRYAAGRVSVVSSIGYGAFLAGPPIIGFIADHAGVLHALSCAGILLVMTHETAMRLPNGGMPDAEPPAVRKLTLLQTDEVRYQNEPVAVVVADTLERATDGARQLQTLIRYEAFEPDTDYPRAKGRAYKPEKMMGRPIDTQRGDVAAGLRQGPNRIDVVYTTPNEHHNPMEPHATMARWDGPKLTLYDATQGVSGTRGAVAKIFGISEDNVRVLCPFVGGGFGCKGSAWSHVVLAAMAAKFTIVVEKTPHADPPPVSSMRHSVHGR